MNEKEEEAYEMGKRVVWANLLNQALRELGHGNEVPNQVAQLVIKHEATVTALRNLCTEASEWLYQWREGEYSISFCKCIVCGGSSRSGFEDVPHSSSCFVPALTAHQKTD